MNDTLSKRLRDIITERSMQKGVLAEKAEVSAGQLSKYIAGTCLPGVETLCRIADTLSVTPDFLLGYSDAHRPELVQTRLELGLSSEAQDGLRKLFEMNRPAVMDRANDYISELYIHAPSMYMKMLEEERDSDIRLFERRLRNIVKSYEKSREADDQKGMSAAAARFDSLPDSLPGSQLCKGKTPSETTFPTSEFFV